MRARLVNAFSHNYATQSPSAKWDDPHLPAKLPLPIGRSPPHLIHQSLDRPHSPPEMASRSSQPFFYNLPTRWTDGQTNRPTNRPTDRLTDRWDKQRVCYNTCLCSIDCIVMQLIMFKSQAVCIFQFLCKHSVLKHATFYKLWVLQRFKTAKVTVSLTLSCTISNIIWSI